MTPQEIDRIQNAINHIKTATDVDQWAMEIAISSMEKQIPVKPTETTWMTRNGILRVCPMCGTAIAGASLFCRRCGQAIDLKEGENGSY